MQRAARPLVLLALGLACAERAPAPAAVASPRSAPPREAPFLPRPLLPVVDGRWIGEGISYGPYRDGQSPGGASPSRAELREDLQLLQERWSLLRLYSADATAAELLALIREDRRPMKVLLGVWIAADAGPGLEANRSQVETALRLAREYPEVVLGLCVGNETQVSWSAHRIPPEALVRWIRETRSGTTLPVATADDFGYWVQPESAQVAREVDFLVTHIYAMWNGQQLEQALDFTRRRYAEVARRHPGLPVVLGEAGWATRKHTEGDQGTLIKAAPGESPQSAFYEQFSGWVRKERIVSTWFEAFDENWKGGSHPDEVEKHWGLFRADRTPKEAMRQRAPAPVPTEAR